MALATDYDGTLATEGRVPDDVLDVLRRVRSSGRKLILVSGRELEDLQSVFDHLDVFDLAVLENGGLLYNPATHEEVLLGSGPPACLVEGLRVRGVAPMSVGRAIVATWEPYEKEALEVIQACGLEHQIIFNKGAVMLLPSGVNKASGLEAALRQLGLSAHNVVGIGDAENDHAFLRFCAVGVAVANALPSLQQRVHWVTQEDHGRGVMAVCRRLLDDDLASLGEELDLGPLVVGDDAGRPLRLPYGANLLVAGSSGGGKSTFTTSLLEQMLEGRYQFCLIDPEGDYDELGSAETTGQRLENVVVVGGPKRPPSLSEIEQLLEDPSQSAVVNLLAVPLDDRPTFLLELFPRLVEMRAKTGRPHWIIIDEVHHVLPAASHVAGQALPVGSGNLVLVTVRPATVAVPALDMVDHVVLIGRHPYHRLQTFAGAVGMAAPQGGVEELPTGKGLLWRRKDGSVSEFDVRTPSLQRRRHRRKYAEGEMPEGEGFYFRGPEQRLNLLANNLVQFLQLADGVDDDTWMYHLGRGEYSRWFLEKVKDPELAEEAAEVEQDAERLDPKESRAIIREAVERIYTLPA